jgi:NADPH-dependent glutamate synthase beta subunit-like oxidoreductase/ferredoxin
MPRLTIDNRDVEVPEGATILEAARRAGIAIPTLCHLEGLPPSTSCMVCVVKVRHPDRLVPSCGAPAEDGMVVESETDEVREARRDALELLLSDHLGDCEAPCRAICPASLDIPRMLRHIAAGRGREAYALARDALVLPATLGRICPAPCEKGCRRGERDEALAIRLSHRFAADAARRMGDVPLPARGGGTGKRVAVVGAGPAGLAAADALLRYGHACTVFDDREKPGGMLRYGVPVERLPRDVLDAEVASVERLGATLRTGVQVGRDVALDDLARDFDAVIVAVGALEEGGAAALGLESSEHGIAVDRKTRQAGRLATPAAAGWRPSIFAAGDAVRKSRMAVRAVADGRAAAVSAHQFLLGMPVAGPDAVFSTHIGKLLDGEMERFLAEGIARGRVAPGGKKVGKKVSGTFFPKKVPDTFYGRAGFTENEARAEALRCLHCDCRKPETCKLRLYASEYGARAGRYKNGRRLFEQRASHPDVIYEPGKCIACGLCVQVAERAREPLGLAFIGRGFDVRVNVPFGRSLAEGLQRVAAECVAACPTGALAMKKSAR